MNNNNRQYGFVPLMPAMMAHIRSRMERTDNQRKSRVVQATRDFLTGRKHPKRQVANRRAAQGNDLK